MDLPWLSKILPLMFGSRALIPIVDTGAGGKRDMFRYTRVSIGFGEEGVGWDESPEELGYAWPEK